MSFKNKEYIAVLAGLLILFGVFVFLGERNISGNAILELDANYHEENLDGNLKLFLDRGEFIPASSKVVLKNNGKEVEFVLRDIVSDDPVNGTYYISGKGVSGEGLGYGVMGKKKEYRNVSFTFRVFPFDDDSDGESGDDLNSSFDVNESEDVVDFGDNESVVEDVIEESGNESVVEDVEDEDVADSGEDEDSSGEGNESVDVGGSVMTGNVVLSSEEVLDGEVFGEDSFFYKLDDDWGAELVSGSLRSDNESLEDDMVKFEIVDSEVVVSSNYYDAEDGFGLDYFEDGERVKVFDIDLSSFDFNFSLGELEVIFMYDDEELASLSSFVKEGDIKEVDKEVVPEISEKSSEGLSEIENSVLIEKFGTNVTKTSRAEIINGRLVRNYKIGKYELVSSYDYDSGLTSRVRVEMKRDEVNFLRDLVDMISRNAVSSENVGELIG